jgi:putative endopeptidase
MKSTFRPATLAVALSLAFAAPFGLAGTTTVASPTDIPAAAPAALSAGLDKSGMDAAARPQDSLFFSMNGTWLKNTPIPADKADYGTFTQLYDLSNERVKGIIEKLGTTPQAPGTVNAKIGDFYKSYMDTAAIDAAGMAPLKPYLAKIDAVKTRADLVRLMGEWAAFVDLPLDLAIGVDPKDPTVYSASANQGGLGIGARDYYLKSDARFAKARTAYRAYLQKLLAAQGSHNAKIEANAVMGFETRLAKAQWTEEALRDPVKHYNPMTVQALAGKAPGMDWKTYLAAGELGDASFVSVSQPSYAWAVARMVKSEPLDVWKAYLRVRLMDALGQELPAEVRTARFQFRGTALNGTPTDRPRWERAVDTVNDALGEAIGQIYVSEYFPPAYKARMVQLVDNLMKAYSTSIDNLTWMSPQTKVEAHAKLAKYGIKIGYPDKWRDYSALDVKAGDALGNAVRAAQFDYHRQAVRNGKPVDRTEWDMTPQTVNAYYEPTRNEIVFPAAILQPPFFDMKADDAANYGAIGAVIGHEISHGFDDQGSQFDGDGKLRNWWTPEDRKAFEAITSKLDAQYTAYEPLPGTHLNGKLTMGENIADLSGLQIAYKAWKMSLGGKPSPTIDGLTGEQRFYYGFSQVWRSKVREARTLQLVVIDPHSPAQFRADGASINSDGFHDAFGTKPGDGMYKPSGERIRIW